MELYQITYERACVQSYKFVDFFFQYMSLNAMQCKILKKMSVIQLS